MGSLSFYDEKEEGVDEEGEGNREELGGEERGETVVRM